MHDNREKGHQSLCGLTNFYLCGWVSENCRLSTRIAFFTPLLAYRMQSIDNMRSNATGFCGESFMQQCTSVR